MTVFNDEMTLARAITELPLVNRDLQYYGGDKVLHKGPITEASIVDGMFRFRLAWVATFCNDKCWICVSGPLYVHVRPTVVLTDSLEFIARPQGNDGKLVKFKIFPSKDKLLAQMVLGIEKYIKPKK